MKPSPWPSLAPPITALLLLALLLAPACVEQHAAPPADLADAPADTSPDADATPDAAPDTTGEADSDAPDVPAVPALAMDFAARDDLFAAPFPSEHRRRPDGGVDLTGYPGVASSAFVGGLVELIERDADGFGVSSAIFLRSGVALDPTSLPSLAGSVAPGASVALMDVDPGSPGLGERVPVEVRFEEDGGPFGTANQLAVLPLQGIVLREETLYAVWVTDAVRTASGQSLEVPAALTTLAEGGAPEGLGGAALEDYRAGLRAIEAEEGVTAGGLRSLAVFRTGAPTRGLVEARDAVLTIPPPAIEAPFVAREVFETYCVFDTTLEMPVYQEGVPPFQFEGGGWARDDAGALVLQGHERSRLVVTLPRTPMPAAGFPVAVFVRTGGGGDRPLVDRGVRAVAGGEAIEAGSGLAVQFTEAGFAGVSVDGPHGGLRNVTGGDEQFIIFNIANPLALRDNIRQSALELIVLAHLLDGVQLDASSCPGLETEGGGPAFFDTTWLTLMGHSMGATIGPLAVALEPRYKAVMLSGAGGSWIENVIFKLRPLEVRPLAELVLGYQGRTLHEHDPALSLLQWAGEPADTAVYAPRLIRYPGPGASPRHVLMFQGILDTYIPPPVANTLTLALGLDVLGEPLDEVTASASGYRHIRHLLPWSGRSVVAGPARGNLGEGAGAVTGVLVQHPEDGVENGHEVVFQTEAPKRQLTLFLQTLRQGAPEVRVER